VQGLEAGSGLMQARAQELVSQRKGREVRQRARRTSS
jgi:hypothetical protein